MKRIAEEVESARTKRGRRYEERLSKEECDERVIQIYDRRNTSVSYERLVLTWLLFDASHVLLPELRAAIRELWLLTAQRQLTFHCFIMGKRVWSETLAINLYEPMAWLCRGFRPHGAWFLTRSRIETDDSCVVVKPRVFDTRDAETLDDEACALRCSLFDLGLDPISLTMFPY